MGLPPRSPVSSMDLILRPFAWAVGALAFGAADLYAVGGSFTQADVLLMMLGALPVVGFAAFVLRSRNPHDN